MNEILQLKRISAGYDERDVITDVTLSIRHNDFIGFIGPNGGGKTTLVKVIVGLIEPTKGSLQFFDKGKAVSHLTIGYLAQKNSIDQQFPIRVKEVVASGLPGKWRFGNFKKNNSEVNRLLEMLQLEKLANASISEISGGEMQRALLGRAIISQPSLLILDEPNTYLDLNSEKILYSLLNQLNSEMAIVLVSHDLGTISSYVKTIACINRSLHYHSTNEITEEMLENYQCPVELVTHGKVPHRVLKDHIHE